MAKKQTLLPQETLDRARQLRRDQTFPVRALWNLLRGNRLAGMKFRRQHPIGPYFADYFCEAEKLVVELDGDSHIGRATEDAERTRYLTTQGLRVFCIGNDDILDDPEAVAHAILQAAGKPIPQ